MMKRVIWMLVLSLLLAGCAAEPDEALNYPDLRWGMGFEEVCEVLCIAEEQIVGWSEREYTDYDELRYTVCNVEFFGLHSPVADLKFLVFEGCEPMFGELVISYPEDTDREALQAKLTKLYAEPTKTWVEEQWLPSLQRMILETRMVPEGTVQWRSELTVLNTADAEILKQTYERYREDQEAQGATVFPTYEQYLAERDGSVSTVTLYRSYNEQHHPYTQEELLQGWTDTVLELNGVRYLEAKHLDAWVGG